jgi:hypothetical protein
LQTASFLSRFIHTLEVFMFNTLESNMRSYVDTVIMKVITKVTRKGQVVGGKVIGCPMPISLVKIEDRDGAFLYSDLTNDDARRVAAGQEALGFGMYAYADIPKFEKDAEDAGGTVGIIYLVPVAYFDDPSEKTGTEQRYRVVYYGKEGGKLLGAEKKLVVSTVPVDKATDGLKTLAVYDEYLKSFCESKGVTDADEAVREAFNRDIWKELEPKVWEVPLQ